MQTYAPYFHLWSVRLWNNFPRYLINGTIFEKKDLFKLTVLCFSPQALSETFLIIKGTERNRIIHVYWSSRKEPVVVVIL